MAAPASRDAEAVSRFIESFAASLAEAGFPRMAARVFVGLLCADEGRLTAAELGETLQASAAAVSGAVRYLIQVGLASRARVPGARRELYRVHEDVWFEALVRRDKALSRWEANLLEGLTAVGEHTPAGARLAETLEFFTFLSKELPALLERWQEYRSTSHDISTTAQ